MNAESENEAKETRALAAMEEKISQMEATLDKIENMLSSTASRMSKLEKSTNAKIISLEERMKALVSPIRPPSRRSFQGLAGLRAVTPAMSITREAIINLTEREDRWVSVEDVAKKTGRSQSTESAYLKLLSRIGAINRKPVYEGTGTNRRVRKYVYSAGR